jgi:hypothetical protein
MCRVHPFSIAFFRRVPPLFAWQSTPLRASAASPQLLVEDGGKNLNGTYYSHQWEFQDPKLEVPTLYKAYFSGLNFREYTHNIWPNIWY